ncbi:MAG TPA: bacterial transcriptional activator domain-containing protein [Roseiflexaceae bacterium]|nr:bacterial transcriptional activator domain-containing protein [Roseiflexaceae bacterium]
MLWLTLTRAAALASLRARLARWWRHAQPSAEPPADASLTRSPDSSYVRRAADDRATAAYHAAPLATSRAAPIADTSANRVSAPPSGAPASEPHATPHHPQLTIYCFGNFRAYVDDLPIDRWDSARGRSLFKYLVARRDTPAPKESLASLFWSESEPELARRSLHQAIYCLRQTFKRLAPDVQIVQFADDRYQLNPEIAVWVDAEAFRHVVEQARALEVAGESEQALRCYATAVELYGGEFLAEERYEAWAEEPRCAYQAMYLGALHRLAYSYHQRGDYSAAITLCQRALAQENCDEESHRLLLACYSAQGLRHLAARQYQLYVHTLQAELGLPPTTEMVAFYKRVVEATPESRNS